MKTEEHDEDTDSPRPEITEVKDNLDEDSSSLNGSTKSEGESELDVDINDAAVENTKEDKSQINLDLILDVPVDLEIELGRKRMPLGKVLELETGFVLALDKTAADPVELYVNGALIATGMLITVDEEDTLGFQVTNIVDRNKRIRSLE